MAKYLRRNLTNGSFQEERGLVASAGATDANKIVETGLDGKLDPSVLPSGLGVKTRTAVAFEALAANDFVAFFNDSGTIKVRKADATNASRRASGYVAQAFAANATATVFYDNEIASGFAGLVLGATYYLNPAVPGGITTTVPTGATNQQIVGIAVSATELLVQIERTIIEGIV